MHVPSFSHPLVRRAGALILATCLAACLTACATGDLSGSRAYGRSLDDSSASLAVKARMLRATHDFSGVDVNIVDGLALLTGFVPDEDSRQEAERIAWSAPNVTEVGNELEIGEAASRRFLGAGDQAVSAQVRARILADPVARSATVNVETFNGIVYLMGRAANAEESARTAELAARVAGVKRVVSYLRTPTGDPAGDVAGDRGGDLGGSNELLGGPETRLPGS